MSVSVLNRLLRLNRCRASLLGISACATARKCSTVDILQDLVDDKKLFTPGPLGVSMTTKQAMLRDLGSRDQEFIDVVKHIRTELLELAGVTSEAYTCIPMQGSGTFSIEAVLTSTVPKNGKVLIIENGSYGRRQMKICDVLGIRYAHLQFEESDKTCPEQVRAALEADGEITNVSLVHCETSSGVINPVQDIGKVIKDINPNIAFFVDAMSSFGAVPLNMADCHIDYLVSSANKCIQGVPGFSFAICKLQHLKGCKGLARSYSLDLVDQYEGLEKTSQFRFTPPTHTMLAFKQALAELKQEGGIEGRSARYQQNRETLREGMTRLGFKEFLSDDHEGYIITSYKFPEHEKFGFQDFYEKLSDLGQVIYPGKVLDADCFRIGNIGHLFPEDMEKLVQCISQVCSEMGMVLPM